jgi:stalled ribosome alternative rescue factor ArfA
MADPKEEAKIEKKDEETNKVATLVHDELNEADVEQVSGGEGHWRIPR